MADQFITPPRLAIEAVAAAETIRRKIAAGEIPAVRVNGRYYLITRADADEFLKRRAERALERGQ